MAEVTEKFSGVIGTSSFLLLIYVSQLLKVRYFPKPWIIFLVVLNCWYNTEEQSS